MAQDDTTAATNNARIDDVQGHFSRPIVYGRQPVAAATSPPLLTSSDIQVSPASVLSTPVAVVHSAQEPEIDSRRRIAGDSGDDKSLLKHSKLTLTLSTMAVVAFIAGIGIGVSSLLLNNQTKNHVAALSNQPSNDSGVPAESEPNANDVDNYQVAASMPRLLTIPKINVRSRIKVVGVNSENRIIAPSNIYDAGWYNGSTKPGQAGTSLIEGHVHGPSKPGVFVDLNKLAVGDKIQVERGDHKLINYKVAKSKVYDANNIDMAAVMSTVSEGHNALNLITCTGSIDYKTDSYSQRLVIFAVEQT